MVTVALLYPPPYHPSKEKGWQNAENVDFVHAEGKELKVGGIGILSSERKAFQGGCS